MQLKIKHKITAGAVFELRTKEELFATIRQITRKGFFFKMYNYYDKTHSVYVIDILSHKDD